MPAPHSPSMALSDQEAASTAPSTVVVTAVESAVAVAQEEDASMSPRSATGSPIDSSASAPASAVEPPSPAEEEEQDESENEEDDEVDSVAPQSVLPTLAGTDVRRISGATMSALLRGEHADQVHDFVVIDCRYDYEYAGGHIAGAININDRGVLSAFFRSRAGGATGAATAESTVEQHKLHIIFHCEFSQNRAPKTYKFFRALDRARNREHYPALSFPEMCVLDGGYKAFHAAFPQHCVRTPLASLSANTLSVPAAGNSSLNHGLYVSMWAAEYHAECKSRTAQHRKSWGSSFDLDSLAKVAHGKSPARGVKRPAMSPSSSREGTPSRTPSRSASMPGGASGSGMMFTPGVGSALFASPMRGNSDAGMGFSPLPSFSLLSAQVSPATPISASETTRRLAAQHDDLDDAAMGLGLRPVPFHMALCGSPER